MGTNPVNVETTKTTEPQACNAVAGTYFCWLDEGHPERLHEAFAGRGEKRGTVKILKFANRYGTEEVWVARRVAKVGEER
jgi:hypothetical protein